jgi:signal transduction histidine kinase
VEVALWRIATEAMTKVVRHADARHCTITILAGNAHVELEVLDDGRGTAGTRPGVGLVAMRERAAELGGRCTLGPGPTSGTRLTASLPTGAP